MHNANDQGFMGSRVQKDMNQTAEERGAGTEGVPIIEGILQKLSEIPVDVLFEIFRWMNPVDLLHLSRTSKNWHNLMMSPSSVSVWRNARSNVPGMPDCPDDLSEPQYASLVFGTSCYFCDRVIPNIVVFWEARLRTCEQCIDTHFMDKPVYPESKPISPYETIMNNIPTLNIGRESGCIMWITELVPIHIYVILLEEYKEVEDQKAWLLEYDERRKSIRQHAQACSHWHDQNRQSLPQLLLET